MTTDELSRVFAALGDPTRRAILSRLKQGDAKVADLAAPFAMSQPAVSRHLRVLEDAGLISRTKRATARINHLEAAPLKTAVTWMVGYRRFWSESFDRLDDLVGELTHLAGPSAGAELSEDVDDARTRDSNRTKGMEP